jgi:hypothetical protein
MKALMPGPRKRTKASRKHKPSRLAQLERALRKKDPLGELNLLVNDKLEPGKTFAFAYACILETNSATLAILFDRFTRSQLDRTEKVLQKIGAIDTLADFRALRGPFDQSVAKGKPPNVASAALDEREELRAIARKYNAHTSEMEECLLAFAKSHVNELAAAKPTLTPETARFIRDALAQGEKAVRSRR